MVDKFHLPMVSLEWCYDDDIGHQAAVDRQIRTPNNGQKNFWAGMVAKSMMWATLLGLAYWLRV